MPNQKCPFHLGLCLVWGKALEGEGKWFQNLLLSVWFRRKISRGKFVVKIFSPQWKRRWAEEMGLWSHNFYFDFLFKPNKTKKYISSYIPFPLFFIFFPLALLSLKQNTALGYTQWRRLMRWQWGATWHSTLRRRFMPQRWSHDRDGGISLLRLGQFRCILWLL